MSAQLDQLLSPRRLAECQAADAALSVTILQAVAPRKVAPLKSERFAALADAAEALRKQIGDFWESFPEEAPLQFHDAFHFAIEALHAAQRHMTNGMHMAEWMEDEDNVPAGFPSWVAHAKSVGVLK